MKDAKNKDIEVFVDGGVRTGSDALKCIALGARCAFIGRGVVYSNAAEGLRGINKMFDMVREEFI